MNIFSTRKAEKVRKAFFSGFLILSLVLSQAALPLSIAYATNGEDQRQTITTDQPTDTQQQEDQQTNKKDDDKKNDDENHKVNICHATGSQNNPWNAISIDQSALQTHLGHGDFAYAGPTDDGKPKHGDDWCGDHAPKPVDVCPNIDGNQVTVPEGKQLVDGSCVDIPQTATLEAQKVVCDTEADLPNWGAHDSTTSITAGTAAAYVMTHSHCKLAPWTFEWAASSATNPGDNAQTGGSGWTAFTSTASTPGTATVPVGSTLWVREQTQSGYVPFSGATTDLTSASAQNSAEIYCDSDVLNYDNFDRTDTINANETHHCVAFNAKIPEQLSCNPEVNLIQNGDFEAPALSANSWDVIPASNPLLKWLVDWVNTPVNTSARLGLEIQNHVAGNPFAGAQHAELDGDAPVTISQNISTIPGKQYSLTFKYSPRPGVTNNALQPKVNGGVLGAVVNADGSANADTVWQTITRTFTASSALTKVEIADVGPEDSLGGYIDNVSLTCTGDPAPQCKEAASSSIVSDTSTQVDSHGAVAVTTPYNAAWSATIPGATWIWSEADVLDATVDTTKTFTKTFSVVGTPLDSTLSIAADNSYVVSINGVPVVGAGCSDISGTTFGAVQTCAIPAAMMTTGVNTLSIAVKNWAVASSDAKSNPAGLLYKFTLNNNECVTPTVHTATVTMCKTDDSESPKPLSGWQLMLKGASAGSVDVLPDGTDYKIFGLPIGSYILKATGMYTYRPGVTGAEYSDAAYSKRDPSDAVYQAVTGDQTAYLPWVRENSFPAEWLGWLGITYNNAVTDWGSVFNPAHIYALGTTLGAAADMTFKIVDNYYADNSGSLNVEAIHGYTGVTGEDGCVTFKDVPYGTYTTDEIMKDGWTNVSGLGEVAVNDPTETFTVVNHKTVVAPTTGSIEITKYVCPADTEVVRSKNGVVGETSVPQGCVLQSGKTFGYVHGEQEDANGPYPELSAALTAGGATGDDGKLTISGLPATGRYLVEETSSDNNKIADGDILGLYCEGDGDTSNNNDNQELTFVPAGGVAHCVVYNKAPVVEQLPVCSDKMDNDEDGLIDSADPACHTDGNVNNPNSYNPAGTTEVNSSAVCSDGKDNDDDGLIDSLDPVCHSDGNANNIDSWNPNGTTESSGGGSGPILPPGGGGNGSRMITGSSNGGQVLGASTQCGLYLDDFLKMGKKNNKDEVKKLQTFLNDYLKLKPKLAVNGIFGIQTYKAVLKFQEQESDYVIKPWVGLTLKDSKKGTGWVYKTTVTRINNIMCPELNLQNPPLTID
jgi:hypothetical protein